MIRDLTTKATRLIAQIYLSSPSPLSLLFLGFFYFLLYVLAVSPPAVF